MQSVWQTADRQPFVCLAAVAGSAQLPRGSWLLVSAESDHPTSIHLLGLHPVPAGWARLQDPALTARATVVDTMTTNPTALH